MAMAFDSPKLLLRGRGGEAESGPSANQGIVRYRTDGPTNLGINPWAAEFGLDSA